jgi:hypothetical protein
MTRRFATLCVLGLVLASAPACRSGAGTGQDASEAARAEAGRRLAGNWVLLSYQPELGLEPMFQSLLAAQFGAMNVSFDGQQMLATGPGVNVVRRYRVTQAWGDRITVVTYDDKGIAYDADGEFRGNDLYFISQTTPWRGRGILRRMR